MNPVITRYGPGDTPDRWTAGDVLCCRNLASWHSKAGFVSAAIRFGQRLRFHGQRRQYCAWNHVVCVADGHLVEALGHGVQRTPYGAYRPAEFWYIATDLTDSQRADSAAWWDWMATTHARYGYVTIAAIAIRLVTGLKVGVSNPQHVICSGLGAAGLGIWKWRANPAFVMPADIAEIHGVTR